MTKEHRLVFALSDLAAIQLQCATCGVAVTQAPTSATVPMQCPVCGASWLRLPAGADPTVGVIAAIRAALQPVAPGPPVEVRLVLDVKGAADGG